MIIVLLLGLGLGIYGHHFQDTSKKYHLESVALTYGAPKIFYEIESTGPEGQTFSYEPEVPMYSGIEVQGKHLNLGINFTDGSSSSDPEDNKYRPTSHVFDIQLSGIKNSILWSAYYQQYKDLYLDMQDKDSPIQYHLDLINYGLGAIYAFNQDIALKDLLGGASLTRRTSSSWLVGVNLNYNSIASNFTIIPNIYATTFQELSDIEKIKTKSASLQVGWAGQFVYKKFYINSYLTIGPTYQEQTLINEENTKSYYPANNSLIEINTGFTFTQSTFGLSVLSQRINTKLDGAEVSSTRLLSSFYYRYFF